MSHVCCWQETCADQVRSIKKAATKVKYMKKLVIAVLSTVSILLGSTFAGGWSHGQYSPGSFGGSADTPSIAHVTQTLQAFGTGISTNSGPLGYYVTQAGPQLMYQGDVGAGSYWIYQQVVNSGYSVTVLTW